MKVKRAADIVSDLKVDEYLSSAYENLVELMDILTDTNDAIQNFDLYSTITDEISKHGVTSALESMFGENFYSSASMEKESETQKESWWQKVKAYLKMLWERFIEFFRKFFGPMTVEELKKKLDKLADQKMQIEYPIRDISMLDITPEGHSTLQKIYNHVDTEDFYPEDVRMLDKPVKERIESDFQIKSTVIADPRELEKAIDEVKKLLDNTEKDLKKLKDERTTPNDLSDNDKVAYQKLTAYYISYLTAYIKRVVKATASVLKVAKIRDYKSDVSDELNKDKYKAQKDKEKREAKMKAEEDDDPIYVRAEPVNA